MATVDHTKSMQEQRSKVTKRSQPLPIGTLLLGALTLTGTMLSLWMIFFYAPTDAIQGDIQRIFYFHVPLELAGMLSFGVLTIASLGYIIRKKEHWDWVARAAAEVGAVFITIGLILGAIWGKETWGTWWVWDPKLTATFILWFIYIGYIMLRSYMGRSTASAYAGAVLALVGIVDLPIIYLSVSWWRGQHPTAQVGVSGALPPTVTLTFLVALATFTLLYTLIMIQVYQLQRLQAMAQHLRASVHS